MLSNAKFGTLGVEKVEIDNVLLLAHGVVVNEAKEPLAFAF
jgi:hypothetical protein